MKIEYKICNLNEEQAILPMRETTTMGQILWQPPPLRVLKINWDAVVNKKMVCIGIGIIAHDCYVFFSRSP